MNKNIIFCIGGIVLGFTIGFFVANAGGGAVVAPVGQPVAPAEEGTAAAGAPGSAPPLDPSQTEMPPNHPDVGAATGGAPAATSAQAQTAMETADRDASDFEAQMGAAAIFYQLQAYDKAELYLKRALAAKPKDADALTAMGDTKYESGDFAGAGSFYERALAERPNDVNLITDIGNTYAQRTPPDYDRAIAEYRKSVAIDPKNEKGWQNIAAAAIRKGDKAAAREATERLAAVNPQNQVLNSLRSSIQALP